LLFWLAGFYLASGDTTTAQEVLFRRDRYQTAREVQRALKEYPGEDGARRIQELFPLSPTEAATIADSLGEPLVLAKQLLGRFSPRWLLGWRRISNAANERTFLMSAISTACATGDSVFLMISTIARRPLIAGLLGCGNSMVLDYVARQKMGGTNLSYFIVRQFSILPPESYDSLFLGSPLSDFVTSRVLELVYTARDVAPMAYDCGYDGPPFRWDEARRFQIRAELDAAYLHAYLGSSDAWKATAAETPENLASLRAYFPTPKDAATHILNSFPLTRDKDEKAHGHYRTRDTILALYEEFTAAHRQQQRWQSPLNPPPGQT
jgi:hypothetical protein